MNTLFITPANEYTSFSTLIKEVLPEAICLPLIQKGYSPKLPDNFEHLGPTTVLDIQMKKGLSPTVSEKLQRALTKAGKDPVVIIISDPDNRNDLHAALIHKELETKGFRAHYFHPYSLEKNYFQQTILNIQAELIRSSTHDHFCKPVLSKATTAILKTMIRIHSAKVLRSVLEQTVKQGKNLVFPTDELEKKAEALETLFEQASSKRSEKKEKSGESDEESEDDGGDIDLKWLTTANVTTIQTIRRLTEEGREKYYEVGIEAFEKPGLSKNETWRVSLPPSALLRKFIENLREENKYPGISRKLEELWKKENLRIHAKADPLITTNFQLSENDQRSFVIQKYTSKEEALSHCKQINSVSSGGPPRFLVIGEEYVPNFQNSRKALTLPEFLATTMTEKSLPSVANSLTVLYNLYNLGWITWPKVNGNTVPDYIADRFSAFHQGRKDFAAKRSRIGKNQEETGEWVISPTKPGIKEKEFYESLKPYWVAEQKKINELRNLPKSLGPATWRISKLFGYEPIAESFETFADIHWTIFLYIHRRFYEYTLPEGHAGEKYCWCVGPVNAKNEIQSLKNCFFFVRQMPKLDPTDNRVEKFPEGHKPTDEELLLKKPMRQEPVVQATVSPMVTYADALQPDDDNLSYLLVCYDLLQPSSLPLNIADLERRHLILRWEELNHCYQKVREDQKKDQEQAKNGAEAMNPQKKLELTKQIRRRNHWLDTAEKTSRQGKESDPDPKSWVCAPGADFIMIRAEQIIPLLVLPKEVRNTQLEVQNSLYGGKSPDDIWHSWVAEIDRQLKNIPEDPLKGLHDWIFSSTRGFQT